MEMSTKHQQVRILAAIALQRATERELQALHKLVSDLSFANFYELIRDVEDEIETSLALGLDRNLEHEHESLNNTGLYFEVERIRRKELKLSVNRFVESLEESLRDDPSVSASAIPPFDSRRGLQAWIKRLSRNFSEPQVYRAVKSMKDRSSHGGSSSVWKLR